jgi:hypothetical protein
MKPSIKPALKLRKGTSTPSSIKSWIFFLNLKVSSVISISSPIDHSEEFLTRLMVECDRFIEREVSVDADSRYG